jgi:hypothetical protein
MERERKKKKKGMYKKRRREARRRGEPVEGEVPTGTSFYI